MKRLFLSVLMLFSLLPFIYGGCGGGGGGDNGGGGQYSISGFIMKNASGFGSVDVSLTGASSLSTNTDTNGYYVFNNLADGTYLIAPSLDGHTFSPQNSSISISGNSEGNVNFNGSFTGYGIVGNVSINSSPLENVLLNLTGVSTDTVRTDSNGHYQFSNLFNGPYNIIPVTGQYVFSPSSTSVDILNSSVFGQNFTATAPPIPTAIYAYVTNEDNDSIMGYEIDPSDGTLSALSGFPVASSERPVALSLHPSKKFLYAGNLGNHNLTGYLIDSQTGSLTPIQGLPVPSEPNLAKIISHPSGDFLYVTHAKNGYLRGYTVNTSTGMLTEMPGSPFQVPGVGSLNPIEIDPSGNYLYVGSLSADYIYAYRVDRSTGALTSVPGSPFSSIYGPQSLSVDPTSTYLYLGNWLGNEIAGHRIDFSNGSLGPVIGTPTSIPSVRVVMTHPSGQYLYAANSNNHLWPNGLYCYRIESSTGALTSVPNFPVSSLESAQDMDITTAGDYILIVNSGGNFISGYSIDSSTGAVSEVPDSPLSTTYMPREIELVEYY